jgi:3-deoxy-7-phosphoheptulonate synthase
MHYEQAQTRYIERQNRWYNLSTHMPWIGMRTAALDGAHVEFFRGIANPMGVKISAAMDEGWLQGLIATLNPQNTPGRLRSFIALARRTWRRLCPRRSRP